MSSENRYRFLRYQIAIAIIALVGAARAQTPAPADLAVDAAQSTLTFHVVHRLHRVDGVSRRVEGRARLLSNGQAQVVVRVPADSFDSGNVNRDAHMKELLEPARFPWVELKATAGDLAPPAQLPATVERTFKARLAFHGVEQLLELPVSLTWTSPTRVRARASLVLSLERFKIERPSLMFVKIDDALKVDADVAFAR
jgi:polyisoprenoid-binding protein YceI